MKKLLAVTAALAVAAPAYASLKVDSRYDYFTANTQSTTSSSYSSESGFLFNRLDLAGEEKITDNVSGKARLNFMSFASAGTLNDTASGNQAAKVSRVNPVLNGLPLGGIPSTGVGDIVDFAQITMRYNNWVAVSAGKFERNGFGGFESEVTSADLYFASQGYFGSLYLTGANVDVTITDTQDIKVYLFNNDNSTDGNRMSYNVVYRGSFGNLDIGANYGVLAEGTTVGTTYGTKDVNRQLVNVGAQYKMGDWKFRLDYDNMTNGGMTGSYTGTINAASYLSNRGNNTQANTVVAAARWDLGNWSPWVQLESTTRTGYQGALSGDSNDSIFNASIAAEYKTNVNDPFRYQAAWVQSSASLAGYANNTVNGSYGFLGVRYMGDLLK